MQAVGVEFGADAREMDRSTGKRLAHAFAIRREVVADTFGVSVADSAIGIAAVCELSGEDRAIVVFFALNVGFLEDDLEAVALTQIECKIDIPAENMRQFHDGLVRQARLEARFKERALDLAG